MDSPSSHEGILASRHFVVDASHCRSFHRWLGDYPVIASVVHVNDPTQNSVRQLSECLRVISDDSLSVEVAQRLAVRLFTERATAQISQQRLAELLLAEGASVNLNDVDQRISCVKFPYASYVSAFYCFTESSLASVRFCIAVAWHQVLARLSDGLGSIAPIA